MPSRQTKTAKRANSQNQTRKNESQVFEDSHARNLLESKPVLTPKSKVKKLSKQAVKKRDAKSRLYGAKNGKTYSEKQLNVPTLNKAVIPGVKAKRGKKGKQFIGDNDILTLTRISKSINDKYEEVAESKLEKSRRLEEIRELKRKEIERKERDKSSKLEDKKDELRSKASLARANRRKNAKNRRNEDEKEETAAKGKKKVSFA